MKNRIIPFIMAGGLASLIGYAAYGIYKNNLVRTVHTIDGYTIAKNEKDGSKTIYSYQKAVLWKDKQCALYLGLDNNNILDDVLYVDFGCDGIVDVIRDYRGATMRAAQKIGEWLDLPIGSSEAFKLANATLAKYRQLLKKHIERAEKERAVMDGKLD